MMQVFDLPRAQLGTQWCAPAYLARTRAGRPTTKARSTKLGDIAAIRSGLYVPQYRDEGSPYLRVDNVREFQLNLNAGDVELVDPADGNIRPRHLAAAGDVIIARTGTLGKAALIPPHLDGAVLSQHVTSLRCVPEVPSGYLATVLNLPFCKEQILGAAFGSTRLELTHEALSRIAVPLIAAEDMRRLSQRVDESVDANMRADIELQDCVRRFEQILGIEQLPAPSNPLHFTAANVAEAEIWSPSFFAPDLLAFDAWLEHVFECKKLGEVSSIERGRGTRVDDYARTGVPFIRTSSIINHTIDPFPDHYATAETVMRFGQPIKEGDLLVSIEGKIGMVAYLSETQQCVFKNHVERVRGLGQLDSVYLFLFLRTRFAQAQLRRFTVVQATLPGLASRLRDIQVPISKRYDADHFKATVQKICIDARAALKRKSRAHAAWANAKIELADLIAD